MDDPEAAADGSAAGSKPHPTGGAAALVGVIAAALRRERNRAGLSLTQLAHRACLAKSTLSQLESGTGNPSVETLWALATALGVPFSRLVDPPVSDVEVIRAGDGFVVYARDADYRATMLSAGPAGRRRDLYRVAADPGRPRISEPHQAGVVEHVVLSAGRALVGPADAPAELAPGDYIRYPGDVRHIFSALGTGAAGILISEWA